MSPSDFALLVISVAAAICAGWGYNMLSPPPNFRAARVLFWISSIGFGSLGIVWAANGDSLPVSRIIMAAVIGAVAASALSWVLWELQIREKGGSLQTALATPSSQPTPPPTHVDEKLAPVPVPAIENAAPQASERKLKEPSLLTAENKIKFSQAEEELATNEGLRSRAYDMADEILAFWRTYSDKESSIRIQYYGVEKDDKILRLDNEASEKFKEQFSVRYGALQGDIKKITKSNKWVMTFGSRMIGVEDIFSAYVTLKEMAKELD
jgi:hypothetical protein